MVCAICESCFTAEDYQNLTVAQGEERPHHLTCSSLETSVKAGCYVCNRLIAQLDPDERRWVTVCAETEDTTTNSKDAKTLQALATRGIKPLTTILARSAASEDYEGCYLVYVSFDSSRVQSAILVKRYHNFRLSLLLRPHDDAGVISPSTRHSRRTDSEESIILARRWIKECLETHKRCKASQSLETRWYPTRLIDCGPVDQANPRCRLIITKELTLSEPYMTLSHCWGRAKCLSLTTSNYRSMVNGISFDSLPRLYQDAVGVTRRLGIRYLWIDSLCIIQEGDSLVDWHSEATLMDKVYRNSYCNISATHASDGNESMFASRNPDALYPQIVNLRVGGQMASHLVLDFRLWETEISTALINKRAWVLQERLLSPRVLHFGERQLFWECETDDDAEIHPKDTALMLFNRASRFKGFLISTTEPKNIDFHPYTYWSRIVIAYTSCQLTVPTDKLVALSAIAKAMIEVHGDDYVAGMWRQYLGQELAWYVLMGHTRRDRETPTTAYRAPSWSWASADGQISTNAPPYSHAALLCKVHDFHLDYATSDPTGVVTGGWLRLWGRLKQVRLTPYHFPGKDPTLTDWEMVVDGMVVSIRVDTHLEPMVFLDRSAADFDEQHARSALFCMPLHFKEVSTPQKARLLDVVLLEMLDSDKGIFRRIGLARGSGPDMRDKFLDQAQGEDRLRCEDYRDGKHLIRIV